MEREAEPQEPCPVLSHCICESSWDTNLELRESDTGIVVLSEDHCNADQQIQLWYCPRSGVFYKKTPLTPGELLLTSSILSGCQFSIDSCMFEADGSAVS